MSDQARDLEGKTLKVLVANSLTKSWRAIKKLEFNDLKEAEDRDVSKLVNAMIETGFLTPFFIWPRGRDHADYVIDGAGRLKALKILESRGMKIPDLPWTEVVAESLEEAKKYVLMAASQHGAVTEDGIRSFLDGIDVGNLNDQVAIPGFETVDFSGLMTDIDVGTSTEGVGEANLVPPDDDNYEPKFGVIIQSDTEEEQQQVFDRLTELGFEPRVVTV